MIDHISLSVLEAVAAPLNVGVPLAVAALGNVIGPVVVIAAIDDPGSRPRGRSRSRARTRSRGRSRSRRRPRPSGDFRSEANEITTVTLPAIRGKMCRIMKLAVARRPLRPLEVPDGGEVPDEGRLTTTRSAMDRRPGWL